jgi:arylsulfatase A-like enzyme
MATGFPGYNGRHPAVRACIAAMLGQHGYSTFGIGKWHNTPSEETGPAGPFDRWPTGPIFGFDRFYGFLAGDNAHKRVHRQTRVADRLDLLAGKFGQDIVVGDVDAELVTAASAARVAS